MRVADPTRLYRMRIGGLCVLLVVVAVASLCLGRYGVSPAQVPTILYGAFAQQVNDIASFWAGLLSGAQAGPEASVQLLPVPAVVDMQADITVTQVRLPRVMLAIIVGAALSVAGAAYQGMFQNPMASQDVLGASSGAAFGASLGILLGFGSLLTSASAFAFGLVAVFVSMLISRISKTNRILSLVLAGMVISALFSSGTSFIKLVADTEDALPAITYWLMGSLASARPADILPVLLLVAVGMVPLYLLRWRLNLLATGEEEARSMGLNASALRAGVVACATFLTATCVSVSGLIGWVGLVIPHFCRLLIGSDFKRVLPACILFGALFLLVVDDFARLVSTAEIPIGILTSFVGAPVFIWLIAKSGGKNAA